MREKQRILIAEDHTIFREGLRAMLAEVPEFEVVGETDNGRDAFQLAGKLSPTIVIMDLSMPDTSGTDAIANIKRRYPEIKVVALTSHKAEAYVKASLKAGANGYVLKDDSCKDLLVAIEKVLRGDTYLSPGVAGKVVSGYLAGGGNEEPATAWDNLTRREREIIRLIADGRKNKEIAELLFLSPKTVEKHRANLMKKLDLHSASELTAYMLKQEIDPG